MMRHLAITTALAGLLAGGMMYGPTVQAQVDRAPADIYRSDTNRPETPPAENRPASDPTNDSDAPVTLPTPVQRDTDSTTMPGNAGSTAAGTMDNAVGPTASMDARELIGAPVKSAENEPIGDIESIYVDQQGEVRSVIVGVGGLFGFGERKVAVGWNALNVADDGQTVHTTLSKDQLKSLPEYKYADNSYRGKIFNDNGIVTN